MTTVLAEAVASGRTRRRWEMWRSPDDQPGWARPALLTIAAVATVLYARNIANAGFEGFYAVAVKSMSVSWKAFIFGAFDPRATITLDKLAGSFVPQAVSARIFGFHAWSLALPQVIEGVVSVLAMYRVVRRWAGPVPGLLAAALFAVTPVAVSMFGHSMEDGALTMCLVLAADSCQRAMLEGRLRSLLWAAFWVGVGFQAKMLQAWIVLPALVAGYLVAAPLPVRRRLRDVAVAGAACLAVSMSWIALYTLTPAADRPYIDGSTDNSAFAMVFGYNGLERFGVHVPGSVTSMIGGPRKATGPMAAAMREMRHMGFGTRSGGGWTKLAGGEFGPQISWLFPLAVLALVCGLLWYRRGSRHGGFVLWGVWLVSFGFVFSAMKVIPHTAYVASLAPALAALSGAGIVMFWREYASGGRRGWLLPIAVAAELGWSLYLWRAFGGFLPAVRWSIVIVGAIAVAALVIAKLPVPARARLVLGASLTGVAAMVAAPAAWAGSALELRYDGSSMNATAGAVPARGFGHLPPAISKLLGIRRHSHGMGGWGAGSGTLDSSQKSVYSYVTAHSGDARYLMAAGGWSQAAPYIVTTGREVMPIGGFSGTVPSPTLDDVRHLVGTGQLRFFLLGQSGFPGRAPGHQTQAITAWVRHSCAPVTSVSWPLYRCEPRDG